MVTAAKAQTRNPALGVAFSITALASRPVRVSSHDAAVDNHDIMLCLDSKSLEKAPNEIISSLESKISELGGQNIGLTMFDRSAINLIPLTDNYGAVMNKLSEIRNHFDNYRQLTASATIANDNAEHSLGGNIIACTNNIDKLEFNNRNKAVVLYTDRSDEDETYMNTLQASEFATRNDVKLYSVDLGIDKSEGASMLYEASSLSGGDYFRPSIAQTGKASAQTQQEMEDLFHSILRQDRESAKNSTEYANRDTPYTYAATAVVCCIAYMFLIWRLKL